MNNPYEGLPETAFWRTAVAKQPPLNAEGWYQPRFPIPRNAKIFTAGSCFAQHVGRALAANGFDVLDAEPAPSSVSDKTAQRFGYGMYSARYGNIYTARQLVQLTREATGAFAPADPVWRKGDAFVDSQRPVVEPDGLPSVPDVLAHRARHLRQVRRAIEATDVFVITLGLTEAWVHQASGDVYPAPPGVHAGDFDPNVYAFKNFTTDDVFRDIAQFRDLIHGIRPHARFVLSVSPVPLTATASGNHILVASSYSKATLRAAAGMAYDQFDDVDYFPAYEIITSPTNRGAYFAANQRAITPQGVSAAMNAFLSAHAPAPRVTLKAAPSHEVQCEESLLEAFAGS